jgi:hypothetical protein
MKQNKLLLFLGFISFLTILAKGQDRKEDCKAFIGTIVAVYEGDCKKGLANGIGKTIGKNYYVGQFKNGKPHGNGKFTWENGNYYDGEWKKGLKEGVGKLVLRQELQPDSIITGIWKDDSYIGEAEVRPYKIIRKQGVSRYRFQQISEDSSNNEVLIKFRRNGTKFNLMQNLQLSGNGMQFEDALAVGFKSPTFPFEGRIDMTVPNQFNTNTFYVTLEYVINIPGKWVITLDL